MLSADLEVWEWDKESGEGLDLLVFNVSLRGGVGSCYKQSRLSVNRLSAVRGRVVGHCSVYFRAITFVSPSCFFEDGVGVWTKGLVTRGGERKLS